MKTTILKIVTVCKSKNFQNSPNLQEQQFSQKLGTIININFGIYNFDIYKFWYIILYM